jgi:murein DD-endopeptidase MepM/ murein hydrolase activator NlpD
MEMQNVIEAQHIAPRQKPVRIIRDQGLISPACNGQIEKKVSKVKIHLRHDFETYSDHHPVSMETITPRPVALQERIHGGIRILETLSSPKSIRTIFLALGILLLAVTIAAVGAVERQADLHEFFLPEDGVATSLLLDALMTLPPETAEEDFMPALPMTLSLSGYRIEKNDTLDAISNRFGIRLDTLISVNGIVDVRRIQAGATLKIPNIDGVAYKVKKGESLSVIASATNVSMLDIIDANDLSSQTITPGQTLFIPGARLSSYDLKKALGKLIIWPVVGRISSTFGYRANPFTGIRQFHAGLDIVGPVNAAINAAMDGRVAETGYSALFGNFVILSHAEGYQTLYAHLNKILVKQGASVLQGKTLGLLGSTGYSTGPHLHLGVFKRGTAVDPLKFLNGK